MTNHKAKVLVACELSGTVRDAFASKGFYAVSCDLMPSDKPGHHFQGDALEIINQGWDLIIAHPPCTYLSKAGARWLYSAGQINQDRLQQGYEGKAFFEAMLNANCPRICVENPTPLKVFNLPTPQQIIQPYQFGHPYSKRTLLWLKNLPQLIPTNVLSEFRPYLPSNTGGKKRGQSFSIGISKNAKESSKTFEGVAEAMADQWGKIL
jgi:hypothetical protein